jgi:hypothetical protein
MGAPLPVNDAMIAREFRLQRCSGSAVDAITNPVVRRVLEAGARARALRNPENETSVQIDAKLRAANDHV